MKKAVLDLRSTLGIDRLQDPTHMERLPQQPGDPQVLQSIMRGMNIDIDKKGKGSRRDGQDLLKSGAYHSIKGFGDICLMAAGANLFRLHEDFTTTTTLYSGIVGTRVSYCRIENEIYFSDRQIIGKLVGGTYSALPGITSGINANRTAFLRFINATRKPMPAGQLLARLGARLYVASGDELWASDPLAFHRTNRKHGLVMRTSGDITMLIPVSDGIFVSDGHRIYFRKGLIPMAQQVSEVADYPAILGVVSDPVDVVFIGGELSAGSYTYFKTTHGICMVGDDGYFKNLSGSRYPEITAKQGTALFRRLQKTIYGQTRTINQFIALSEN
jgi:hypothetical protein